MKKKLLAGVILVIVVVTFVFVPWIQVMTGSLGGGPDSIGWVSPSFLLFQCGAAMGQYGIQVPNGAAVYPRPHDTFWSSFWNCDYPHL